MADRATRQAKLEELRAARAGEIRKRTYKDNNTDLYDVVDEEDYAAIVRGRLQEDDFIEDDGVGGYVDNGMEEDWDKDSGGSSQDEDRKAKRKRKKDAKGKPDPKKRLNATVFSNAAPKPVPRPAPQDINPYKKTVDVGQEADFMSSLLGDLETSTPTSFMNNSLGSSTSGRKRKTSPDLLSSVRNSTSATFRKPRFSNMSNATSSSSPLGIDDSLSARHDASSGSEVESFPSDAKRPRHDLAGADSSFDHQLNDLDFGNGDDYASFGAQDVDMETVKQEQPAEDDDIFVKTANPAAVAAARARPARQLVNAASIKAAKPVISAKPLPEGEAKPDVSKDHKKPKGMDWRLATASIAVADTSSDPLPIDDLPSTSTKKGRPAKTANGDAAPITSKIKAFENDGETLRFYWLDHLDNNGVVQLSGKVFDKETNKYVSCCLSVEGIQRNLFVLPRGSKAEEEKFKLSSSKKSEKAETIQKKKKEEKDLDDEDREDDSDSASDEAEEDADSDAAESDYGPTLDDVYDEFDEVRQEAGITSWASKEVTRKYAFELPNVPAESRYLKVVYDFNQPQLPMDLSGKTFKRVFGTNTTPFELFVIKRKIMGPCWLEVKNAELTAGSVSWCKLEVKVRSPKQVNPFKDSDPKAPKDIPPLTIMSLSLRTIVNHKENKREIICASTRTWQDSNLEDTKPLKDQPSSLNTVVRPLSTFPNGFETLAKTDKSKVTTVRAERVVLNNLLATIHRYDPDVIIGHDFTGVTLDVLLHRLRELKADHWSRLGRFKRDKWPRLRNGLNSHVLNGRLVLDLSSEGSKSMITSTTWSLTEMCLTHLKVDRIDIDPEDTADYFDSYAAKPDKLMSFVRHCEADAYFQAAIANQVQALPLTKQLTNLAGNSWNRTLGGGRAERNEYILLHEFHKGKYICPDKISTWEKKAAAAARAADPDNDEPETTKKGSKKDKFKGGLVFDPKRGLWDKYILVMDFNSLYPSIIQEYNIDFTTVVRHHLSNETDKIPEVPTVEERGVLPRLIQTLVERRRAVKGLMKDKSASPAKILQYDIKQKALKLTANSMYGCLGFEGSRFYARPLAALTTSKGREILTNTRELAESISLDVIYGDTDSVMINTNVTKLSEAFRIGNEFKKLVNERYRLLEIDIDNVFQRMLLLQKKKYAAVEMKENGETSIEIKGLDMKRREYCALSKNVSGYVLKQILSGEPTEVVVEKIHEYLATVGEGVRSGKVALDDFIIWKRLGKNPQDYPDAKNQPHVQVALRQKQRGQEAKAGDVIPYIFCLGEDGQTARSAQADKAHHPDELRRTDSTLKIDFEHYLSLQVLPPVERLCDQIEGTERSRLAECLGLDVSRFQQASAGIADVEREFHTLESQISDKDRFRDTEPLRIVCRHCQNEMIFGGLLDNDTRIIRPAGFTCNNQECSNLIDLSSLSVQLDHQIRAFITKFYEGWLLCDDASCLNRTRMMSVYGKRCLREHCRGSMHYEYNDSHLYTQLLFFDHLFDAEKAKTKAAGTSQQDEVHILATHNAASFELVRQTVQRYLERCGRRYIGMKSLFGFMRLA